MLEISYSVNNSVEYDLQMGGTCGTSSTTNAGTCNSYPVVEQETYN